MKTKPKHGGTAHLRAEQNSRAQQTIIKTSQNYERKPRGEQSVAMVVSGLLLLYSIQRITYNVQRALNTQHYVQRPRSVTKKPSQPDRRTHKREQKNTYTTTWSECLSVSKSVCVCVCVWFKLGMIKITRQTERYLATTTARRTLQRYQNTITSKTRGYPRTPQSVVRLLLLN